MANERKCKICGSTYEYCPRCRQYSNLPTWKINYCSEGCKAIYEVVNSYSFNHIDATQANNMLATLDTDKVINGGVKACIDEIKILTSVVEEKPKKKKKNYVEEVVEMPTTEKYPVEDEFVAVVEPIIYDEELVNVD